MARNSKKRNGRVIRIQDEQQNQIQRPRKKNVKLIPRNTAQEDYILSLHNPSQRIIVTSGPAGTGKTYLGTSKAIQLLQEGAINKIIITRPAVCADEKLGYLPGSLEQKMNPFLIPILDVFEEYYSPKEIKIMMDEKILEICPLAFMRGRNFKDSFILADEMQNSSPNQMKMLLTRISEGTRIVVTGDITQHDRGKNENGLQDFIERYHKKLSGTISIIEFTNEHVERDEIVKSVLNIYGEGN